MVSDYLEEEKVISHDTHRALKRRIVECVGPFNARPGELEQKLNALRGKAYIIEMEHSAQDPAGPVICYRIRILAQRDLPDHFPVPMPEPPIPGLPDPLTYRKDLRDFVEKQG